MIKIEESNFSEEFENNKEDIFLLEKNEANSFWEEKVDKNANSFFTLSDENWLIKKEKKILGNWIDSYNTDNYNGLYDLFDKLNWNDADDVYFSASKFIVIKSTWKAFKKKWINFLECDDDCPILINSEKAIIFNPIGSISITVDSFEFNISKFEIKTDKSEQFRFNLKAGNGQTILSSEAYTTKAACNNGIESVKTNSQDDARYDRLTAKDGSPYFNLKASNGQIIGTSEMYSSNDAMENGIASVKNNAPNATVEEFS